MDYPGDAFHTFMDLDSAIYLAVNGTVGLLDYDKNHNHDYFGQYCNHDYLTRLLAGRITNFFFYANLKYSVNSLL